MNLGEHDLHNRETQLLYSYSEIPILSHQEYIF